MRILPLHPEIKEYLKNRNLEKKFEKQKRLFEKNPFHYSSLKTELLEPKKIRIWIFREKSVVEIIDVNDHYQ